MLQVEALGKLIKNMKIHGGGEVRVTYTVWARMECFSDHHFLRRDAMQFSRNMLMLQGNPLSPPSQSASVYQRCESTGSSKILVNIFHTTG